MFKPKIETNRSSVGYCMTGFKQINPSIQFATVCQQSLSNWPVKPGQTFIQQLSTDRCYWFDLLKIRAKYTVTDIAVGDTYLTSLKPVKPIYNGDPCYLGAMTWTPLKIFEPPYTFWVFAPSSPLCSIYYLPCYRTIPSKTAYQDERFDQVPLIISRANHWFSQANHSPRTWVRVPFSLLTCWVLLLNELWFC